MTEALESSAGTIRYAPFGKRLMAFILDSFVLGLVMLVMQFTIPYLAPLLVWIGYKALFECSSVQATPGKRAMDLIVVGPHGGRITLGTSLLRTVVAWVSLVTGFLIYLVALFTPKKQTIHDLIASTFVIEGRIPADPGTAWTQETKNLYEGARSVLKNVRWHSERERLELLEKLDALRKSGAITEEEFEARKKAILNQQP